MLQMYCDITKFIKSTYINTNKTQFGYESYPVSFFASPTCLLPLIILTRCTPFPSLSLSLPHQPVEISLSLLTVQPNIEFIIRPLLPLPPSFAASPWISSVLSVPHFFLANLWFCRYSCSSSSHLKVSLSIVLSDETSSSLLAPRCHWLLLSSHVEAPPEHTEPISAPP